MLDIQGFGDALLMCMCNRINVLLLGHIWKSAYSLGILMVIRVGNSTILLQRKQLYLRAEFAEHYMLG